MASISTERLKEMEAEMFRFEAEIANKPEAGGRLLPPPPPPNIEVTGKKSRVIIGSNTFSEVQEKLSQPEDFEKPESFPGKALPPPPPPPLSDAKPSSVAPLVPPPPPPQLPRPNFMPPQLRHRPPAPPFPPRFPDYGPNRPMGPGDGPFPPHPGGGFRPGFGGYGPRFPPRMGPGPMSPMPPRPRFPPRGGPGMGRPPHPHRIPGHFQQEQPQHSEANMNSTVEVPETQPSGVIEAKSVIYKPPTKAAEAAKEQLEATLTNDPPPAEPGPSTSANREVAPGIEVNVPAEEFQVQKFSLEDGTQIVVPQIDVEAFVEKYRKEKAKEKKEKKKKVMRTGGGQVWEDPSMDDWPTDDFRVFCGDLGNEVTDEVLARAFSKYPSFQKARVVRDKRTNKTRGYGFISFKDPNDFVRAIREMNGKYVGNRPIKLRKSSWKDRQCDVFKKKEKEKKKLGFR